MICNQQLNIQIVKYFKKFQKKFILFLILLNLLGEFVDKGEYYVVIEIFFKIIVTNMIYRKNYTYQHDIYKKKY